MSAAAVLVVAGVLAGTMLANAAGPPLPKRTPAQLLVAMHDARPPEAFSGVITESANLGFPSLPNIPGLQSSVLSGASFITGTHTIDVWYDGPRHARIALPVSFGETDLRVNGNQVWLWDSHGQTATHYILPAAPSGAQIKRMKVARLKIFKQVHPRLVLPRCLAAVRQRLTDHPGDPAGARRAIAKCLKGMKIGRQVPIAVRPLTPQQAADKFLAAIGPTTKVTVAGSTVVAGRSAYQLVIAPRTSQSLISQIVIAVDSKTYLPLQLQVFASGTSSPAFQIGFTSLTFGKPAASNFTFTPPAGAHVKTEKLPAVMPGMVGPLSLGGLPAPLPGPFTSQRFLPHGPFSRLKDVKRAVWSLSAPAAIGSVKGRTYINVPKGVRRVWSVGKSGPPKRVAVHFAPNSYAGYASTSQVIVSASPIDVPNSYSSFAPDAVPAVKVLGSGWLSVAVIPAGKALAGFPPSSAKQAHPLVLPAGSAPAGQISALLRILLNSAAPVHGTWGSGRLLRTNLFSALITSNGKVLIGAVTPAVLYADAAKVK
jgi:outer membrane lipoprotein-sorting protein